MGEAVKTNEAMEVVPDESTNSSVLDDAKLLKRLLKHLDLNDLLICRLVFQMRISSSPPPVNRKWKQTVESLRLDNLSARSPNATVERTYYYPDYRSIKSDHQFLTVNRNFLQARVMQTILGSLKRLSIEFPKKPYYWLRRYFFPFVNCLNQLQQLQQLQIVELNVERNSVLRLAKLEYLSIQRFSGKTLKIDCPNLFAFETDFNLQKFEFVHPHHIRWYRTKLFEQPVEKFVNLERYWCRNILHMKPGLLKQLPKLETLYCNEDARFDLFNDLLSARRKLRRLEFRISYGGLKIQTADDLRGLPESRTGVLFVVNNSFQILLDNYERLDNVLPYIQKINYNSLLAGKHFRGTIDLDEFLGRFVGIEWVEVTSAISDKQQFVEFIRCHGILKILELSNGELGQEFYDALHDHRPHIVGLIISEQQPLRLEFLRKLKSLVCFSVNQLPTYGQFCEAFDSTRLKGPLRTFRFIIAEKSFEVRVNRKFGSKFKLTVNKEPPEPKSTAKTLDFDCKRQMAEFIKMLIQIYSPIEDET